jgi:hypothetical protein
LYSYSNGSSGRATREQVPQDPSMDSDRARFDDFSYLLPRSSQIQELHIWALPVEKDETKDLIPVLKKNYGLGEIPGFQHGVRAGDIHSILQLNKEGRRYLVHYGSSISKSVDVLSTVRCQRGRYCTLTKHTIFLMRSPPIRIRVAGGGVVRQHRLTLEQEPATCVTYEPVVCSSEDSRED